MNFVLQVGGSLVAILLLAWLSRAMGLGGDARIRDEDDARRLASEAMFGFEPVAIAIDRAGMGALLRDAEGRQMLLRRHGARFVGRLLDSGVDARLDRNFLTISAGSPGRGPVTLNLGEAAQIWAAGLRHLRA
jgi:hypothetical protein